MEETTYIDQPAEKTDGSLTAARISTITAGTALALFTALHFLKPEFAPSWRMASEYAIGDYGWMMRLVFFSLALGCAALFFAVRTHVETVGGKIGLGFLLAACLGMTLAGIFAIDPITGTPDQATSNGSMHGIASLIGVPSFPIAAVLISASLARRKVLPVSRTLLLWPAHAVWISLVWMIATIGFTLPAAGGFSPAVPVGWPNRVMILAYCLWMFTTAQAVTRVHTPPRS